MWTEEIEIDPVGNDRPVRFEVPVERDRRGVRDRYNRGHAIHFFLKPWPRKLVRVRMVEVSVKRSHNRTVGGIDRKDRQGWNQWRMYVHDVVLSAPENVLELFLEVYADRKARVRSMHEHGLTASDTDDVRIGRAAFDVRCDDVDMMPEPTSFSRKEMHVLADTAEMRVVILGDERDSERA